MTRTIVVVGAGIAGVRFVQKYRVLGGLDNVVLIGSEPHAPYDRPPLSKQVLRGERGLPVLLSDEEWTALDVDLHLGVNALALDADQRQLITDAGRLGYDRLVVASGAEPIQIPGLDGQVLRSWDDAADLRDRLTPGTSIAVIGAGLVGCEVAASARLLGCEVHLIDRLETPMARVLGWALAAEVMQLHCDNGVELHLATEVSELRGSTLTLTDGAAVQPEVVLHAVGVRPRTAWLAGTCLDRPNGVPCDAHGRSAVAGIYAVGDVACWDGHRAEHWTSAAEQAERTAAFCAGVPVGPASVPYWWSDQYDIKFQGLGDVAGADEVRKLSWGAKHRPLALYARCGALIGAVGMSAAAGLMRLRNDIATHAPLDEAYASLI